MALKLLSAPEGALWEQWCGCFCASVSNAAFAVSWNRRSNVLRGTVEVTFELTGCLHLIPRVSTQQCLWHTSRMKHGMGVQASHEDLGVVEPALIQWVVESKKQRS
mmetsp:Transcript_14105/g.23429  ORF Transcript_14105/g.23429 Transcript_14105/m.23429 type:complete len:106 (-) Transcript_14105:157-474(-)